MVDISNNLVDIWFFFWWSIFDKTPVAALYCTYCSVYFHFGGEKTWTQVCCPQILSANLGLRHLSIGYPIIFKDLFWKTATSNFLPIPLKSNIFEITFVFLKKLRFAMFDGKALEVWGFSHHNKSHNHSRSYNFFQVRLLSGIT